MKGDITRGEDDDRDNFRLRQFFPVTIRRAAAAITSSKNALSIAAAALQPIRADSPTAARPAIQTASSIKSGPPWIGRRPVHWNGRQKKPVTMAGTKP